MHWLVKLGIIWIYYFVIGAVVIIIDLLRYNEEYTDNLKEMLSNLDTEMRSSVDSSDFVAIEICARMFFNEVLIWPIVFIARLLEFFLDKDGD